MPDSLYRLTLHVRPDILEWGGEDDRWRADLADLERRLRRELPAETIDHGMTEGRRGPQEISDVILALGSAGAMTAAVEVIKSWIGAKPGRRKVKVAFDEGGAKRTVLVDADGMGAQELMNVATVALGGPPPNAEDPSPSVSPRPDQADEG